MGILAILLQFIVGGFKSLFGGGGAKAPPKPADVVSEQAATAPTLAAEAARDRQVVVDASAAQTAQEAGNAKLQAASDARAAVVADSVRDSSEASVYADDGFRRD